METKTQITISEDRFIECACNEEKKHEVAKEIANKLLREIEFKLYMDAIDRGKT